MIAGAALRMSPARKTSLFLIIYNTKAPGSFEPGAFHSVLVYMEMKANLRMNSTPMMVTTTSFFSYLPVSRRIST